MSESVARYVSPARRTLIVRIEDEFREWGIGRGDPRVRLAMYTRDDRADRSGARGRMGRSRTVRENRWVGFEEGGR